MEYDFAFFDTDRSDELSTATMDYINHMADQGWQLKQIVVTRTASESHRVCGNLTVIMERNKVAVVPANEGTISA